MFRRCRQGMRRVLASSIFREQLMDMSHSELLLRTLSSSTVLETPPHFHKNQLEEGKADMPQITFKLSPLARK